MAPDATQSAPSNAVYTAKGTSNFDTSDTTFSSVVYRRAHASFTSKMATETSASSTRIIANATSDACLARRARPAPSSLEQRVSAATEKPMGNMNARALVIWKMLTAATLRSGSGSHPAMRMFSSLAHHSAIIRMPGSASRRNGSHSDVASRRLHPVHVFGASSSPPPRRFKSALSLKKHRYATLMESTTPLLQDVASPAPAYPQPKACMNR